MSTSWRCASRCWASRSDSLSQASARHLRADETPHCSLQETLNHDSALAAHTRADSNEVSAPSTRSDRTCLSPISSISASPTGRPAAATGERPWFARTEDQALARLQQAATDALDKSDHPRAGTSTTLRHERRHDTPVRLAAQFVPRAVAFDCRPLLADGSFGAAVCTGPTADVEKRVNVATDERCDGSFGGRRHGVVDRLHEEQGEGARPG